MRGTLLTMIVASILSVSASELSFTESLREEAGSNWTAVIAHKFTDELAAGSISKDVLTRYLIQDHRFIDAFVVLLSSMVAAAPTLKDRIPGAQFLGLITGKENTYFERSFEALGVTEVERAVPNAPVQAAFEGLMRDAAHSGSLASMLAVLVVAEWSYQSWGERVLPVSVAEPFWCREWVDLHSGEYFGSVVGYLRGLLDRVIPTLPPAEVEAARAYFACAVQLELVFFDQAYSVAPLPAPTCSALIAIQRPRTSWWRKALGLKPRQP